MRRPLLALSVALPLAVVFAQDIAVARPLTFEERVSAQEAIERAYFSRQIGATGTFEETVARRDLESKVRTYLEQSAALERLWRTPVTGAMLGREVTRMVEETQMPDRLRELFAALGNDPVLIQECLARPVLVDRLARHFFAFDQSIHAASRARAESLRQGLAEGRIDPRAGHPQRAVEEVAEGPGEAGVGAVGRVDEERERFVVRVPLERSRDAFRVATYSVAKEDWDGWWARAKKEFEESSVEAVAADAEPVVAAAVASEKILAPSPCVNDTWDGGLLDEIPDREAPRVWTGSLMLIWGGSTRDNKGWRYDPITDTWSPMSRVNAPPGRSGHLAVWTGSRMIVWGGIPATGGRYDPVADTWTPVSSLNSPLGLTNPVAVWTGNAMLVWGGYSDFGGGSWKGSLYNPSTDTWSPMSIANAPLARSFYSAVWAGGRFIVWGGLNNGPLNTGGRYDPVTDTWAPTSTTDAPPPRYYPGAVSTGNQMLIWGGDGGPGGLDTGGRYDPSADTWAPTSMTNAPTARWGHATVWAGSEMVIWGGYGGTGYLNSGGRYSPDSDTWTTTSTSNAPFPRVIPNDALLWTGSQVLVWGGGAGGYSFTGGRYQLATDSWTPISTGSAPTARKAHSAVWTGSQMVIWGGRSDETSPATYLMTGGRYDPALAAWSPTSTAGAPSPRSDHTVVWTGSRMIVWGGLGGGPTQTGGRYDPLTDTWLPTSVTGAPSPRNAHTAVWTGSRMIVWGGKSFTTLTNTGGRYDPETDTWEPTSTAGAPPFGYEHTAVWTGNLMLVWGGSNESQVFNTGARYDPAADTWSLMSSTGAPSARTFHGAVWTGQRMVVWGGSMGGSGAGPFNTGGRYDPLENSWTATAPAFAGGSQHSTVWTGSRMVVWGGRGGPSGAVDTGGRYDPGINSWQTASTADVPAGRFEHTAVWTGDRMIVWGGAMFGAGQFGTGALYCACAGGPVATYYQDADGDGYGIPGVSVPSCSPPAGYAANSADCNDTNAGTFPGAAEICNGRDDDCDGMVDEGISVDNDGDGFACSGDCDDFDPAVHPGAGEICDQKDNDCDGFLPADERDDDGDQFAICEGDCRDDIPGLHPGAPEGCDGIDTDCDGSVPAVEADADGDGFRACAGDCADTDPARHPGAAEVCNLADDDCDGSVDEGMPDTDGDGHVDCSDCQPSDPYTWGSPPQVTNLQIVQESGTDYCVWDDLYPATGLSVLYDVFAGSVAALRQGGGSFSTGSCLLSGLSSNAFDFSAVAPPAPGDAIYLIVRGQNPCGVGTYGSAPRDQSASVSPNACP